MSDILTANETQKAFTGTRVGIWDRVWMAVHNAAGKLSIVLTEEQTDAFTAAVLAGVAELFSPLDGGVVLSAQANNKLEDDEDVRLVGPTDDEEEEDLDDEDFDDEDDEDEDFYDEEDEEE